MVDYSSLPLQLAWGVGVGRKLRLHSRHASSDHFLWASHYLDSTTATSTLTTRLGSGWPGNWVRALEGRTWDLGREWRTWFGGLRLEGLGFGLADLGTWIGGFHWTTMTSTLTTTSTSTTSTSTSETTNLPAPKDFVGIEGIPDYQDIFFFGL